MEFLSFVFEVIRDLLIFVAVMTGLLVVLVIAVFRMPDTNPLKRLLTALTFKLAARLGVTAAAGVLAVPIEPIPGVDLAYDLAVPILLAWYWFTFFRELFRGGLEGFRGAGTAPAGTPPAPAPGGPAIDHAPPRRF